MAEMTLNEINVGLFDEVKSLKLQLASAQALIAEAPKFFAPQHDFDGEKHGWLVRANLL